MSKALPNAYICTDGQDPYWDKKEMSDEDFLDEILSPLPFEEVRVSYPDGSSYITTTADEAKRLIIAHYTKKLEVAKLKAQNAAYNRAIGIARKHFDYEEDVEDYADYVINDLTPK